MSAMYKPGDGAAVKKKPPTMHHDCRLFGATLLSFALLQSKQRLLFTTLSPTFDFGSGTDSKWAEFLIPPPPPPCLPHRSVSFTTSFDIS